MIRQRIPIIFVLGAFIWVGFVAGASGSDQASPQKQSKAKAGTESLTGCIDQQAGRYVLIDDRDLKPVADLEADGFPTEGFAKYMGTKVTVRGTVNSDGAEKRVKVRTIEKVSDTCTASQEKK